MQEMYLREINIYPIKSLGGISLQKAEVQQTGLQHDRRWMLVDEKGQFLSQRTLACMAMLQVSLMQDGLLISPKKNSLQPLFIPFNASTRKELAVSIWDDVCTAVEVSAEANEWFTHALGVKAQLAYMPESTQRFADNNYAKNNEIVSFADGYPLLMVGQSSLDDLNERLPSPILMKRFRPNLVFCGGTPFCEDSFKEFRVGEVTFNAVKPCARCVMTTINQEDGTKGQEPLRTLATYRTKGNKILFGQNLLQNNRGTIQIGDKIEVLSTSI